MATPSTLANYESLIDLQLGSGPNVQDPEVHQALLDIHNALEILATHTAGSESALPYVLKQRTVLLVNASYTVLPTDGTIIVAANTADIIITLPPAADNPGYKYTVKCIDDTYATTVVGDGVETIDGYSDGIGLQKEDSMTVRSDGTNWHII